MIGQTVAGWIARWGKLSPPSRTQPIQFANRRYCPDCEVGWSGYTLSECWNCGRTGKAGVI